MIKYGLISETDARCLEKTIDLICDGFKNEFINVTEIGLFDCETAIGLWRYIGQEKVRHCNYTGIDNQKDKEINPPSFLNLIIGNSNEVYNQIEDNSQHLIFVDGCHCFAHVVSDFFCYAPKVKVGGYIAFHDTGVHIKEFKDFQHGDKNNPDAYISCRKALEQIGLFKQPLLKVDVSALDNIDYGDDEDREFAVEALRVFAKTGTLYYKSRMPLFDQWELILDEADETNEAGGVTVFKKLY